jgi:S-adenosylmethionine:tRNA ribosyltransferase-isomerase
VPSAAVATGTPAVARDLPPLPPELRAGEPPELRGMRRDHVKLMVVERDKRTITHTRFDRIGDFLGAGDLMVVNGSRTLAAALTAERRDGSKVQLRPCVRRPGLWDMLAVEPAPPYRNLPLRTGELLDVGGRLFGRVVQRRPDIPLLWQIQVIDNSVAIFAEHGEPIRYSYVPRRIPIDYYQTVYATEPGSAESPSAGRPLSWELINRLRAGDVGMAEIILHTGLSSYQNDDFDLEHRLFEEWFRISEATAAAVTSASRVVAVGTTVVRALETAGAAGGAVQPMSGWTDLKLGPGSPIQVAGAMITGLHEPQASHFDLLEAFVDFDLLARAYEEAIDRRYLWHEFGDSMLIV